MFKIASLRFHVKTGRTFDFILKIEHIPFDIINSVHSLTL